jgi:hypothetical protein
MRADEAHIEDPGAIPHGPIDSRYQNMRGRLGERALSFADARKDIACSMKASNSSGGIRLTSFSIFSRTRCVTAMMRTSKHVPYYSTLASSNHQPRVAGIRTAAYLISE